jgi:hypothetical protein
MATSEPIEVTLAVTSVLERLEVEYVVGGSLATIILSIPCLVRGKTAPHPVFTTLPGCILALA